jgi:hypothetical protein
MVFNSVAVEAERRGRADVDRQHLVVFLAEQVQSRSKIV